LKEGGEILLTGKNIDYADDDHEAFIAERNARLKNFPNHFTKVRFLIEKIQWFGFEIVESLFCEKRGDLSEKNFHFDINDIGPFYEYCLVLRKCGPPNNKDVIICDEYSWNSQNRAREAGFSSVLSFFKEHTIKA